jgi:hypothetical protein
MRLATFSFSVAVTYLVFASFPAFAQQTPGTPGESPAPPAMTAPPPPAAAPTVGAAPPVSHPQLPPGSADKSPEETVPLTPVRAAPCSVSARETDGTTTCIGLPSESRAGKRRR